MALQYILTFYRNNRNFVLHIAVWVFYAAFIFITNLLTKPDTTITEAIFYLLPFVITFYITVYCLNLYSEKGVWWSVASFFIVFFVMALLGYIYIYWILPSLGVVVYSTREYHPFLKEAIRGYLRFFSFALLYFYYQQSVKNGKVLRMLEREKAQKELENSRLKQQELKTQQEKTQYEYAFLRSQVNPHFLHNTLNTLFSEALNYSPELADNILKLSSIMRYSMEALEFESGKVKVQKELEHLQTLLDINNLRFGKSKTIRYTVTGEINDQMIPPLSFITIVENAFKYGDLKDPDHPLTIQVDVRPEEVYFYCKNKIKKNGIQISSTNIGISNLSKRLDVAFKNKYEMKVNKDDNFYIFELVVKT